jgi:hypothetical protein
MTQLRRIPPEDAGRSGLEAVLQRAVVLKAQQAITQN